ncbi:prolyl oligopeptidase family serine peptidase [Salininema proteolyticum]|uniref:Prolyl oligopeptidase family serine peptidase n=1 Tax=Salininema proteolyticum TaxID=1607685 RepID=A0ABV8TV45_9ACTN
MEWPRGVAAPARRALEAAGITDLEQACRYGRARLARLHGMGPRALRALEEAAHERGLSLRPLWDCDHRAHRDGHRRGYSVGIDPRFQGVAVSEQTPEKRRHPVRIVVVSLMVVAVLALGGIGAAGWYFSGEVIDVDHSPAEYSLTVTGVEDGRVTLPADEDTLRPGTWGLEWDGGRAVMGPVRAIEGTTVTREVLAVLEGDLAEGLAVSVDRYTYGDDPEQAFGIDYEDVTVSGPLGDYPGWYVPGEGDTWVIAVHGRNASPRETLRALPAIVEAGFPYLAVTYRNDEGAPAAPDGNHHLGASEWEDVAAAVDYARGEGAEDVVLYGWSMGGSLVAEAYRNMDSSPVRAMIVDSPVMDWDSTLDMQADDRDVPGVVTWSAKRIVEWRSNLSIDGLDQRSWAGELDVPMLGFVDTADETVDHTATLEFFDAAPPDLVEVVETSAGHTASWNADSEAYERAVVEFLGRLRA